MGNGNVGKVTGSLWRRCSEPQTTENESGPIRFEREMDTLTCVHRLKVYLYLTAEFNSDHFQIDELTNLERATVLSVRCTIADMTSVIAVVKIIQKDETLGCFFHKTFEEYTFHKYLHV